MSHLTGRVLRPGVPGWGAACQGFAEWAPYNQNVPQVIVFCQDTHDVVNAVNWARENQVPLRVRSGRHNYEAFSSLVKDGIIVDVSEIGFIRAEAGGTHATVGAGLDIVSLMEGLNDVGVSIPAATGASVGLCGLTLGGGFGMTTRLWGMTCDNLTGLEIVTADGQVLKASAAEHPDLFWACRGGGGGNFGVVTAFTFKVHPVGNTVIFNLTWGWEAFEAVVDAWQRWAPVTDNRVSTALMLLSTRSIKLYGQFTAADQDLPLIQSLLAPMLAAAPAQSVSINVVPYIVATRTFLRVDPLNPQWFVEPHDDDQIFKSTSAYVFDLLDSGGIRTLKTYLEDPPGQSCPPSQPSMVQLLGAGGAVQDIPPDATAVYARAAKFIIQYDAYWTAPQDEIPTLDWAEAFRTAMQPWTRGAYVNYVDLRIADYLEEYYGQNLPRLVQIKAQYDPGNLFNFPQSIPVALPG
jgi:FAD/FMN-containing dehydrogenase